MNIYIYEIKAQLKSFIIWTIALLLTMFIFMGGIYPTFQKSAVDLLKVMEGFPKPFTQVFGFQMFSIFSYGGYYSFAFAYIGLVAAIMAVIVSLSIFAREKRVKCLDFLVTKPISRSKIFGVKLLVSFTIIGATNVIYVVGNMIMFNQNNQSSDLTGRFILASLGIFFTQFLFLAIGIFVATFSKKIRSVSGLATAIGFIAFILSALANIIDDEIVNLIAPLKYFDPSNMMAKGYFQAKYIWVAAFIIIFCTVISYIRFCKSDIHAV